MFACNPKGDVVLGSPTGTEEYRALQCLSIVGEMEACLPTLARLQVDPLIATNLIRYGVNSKPSYLARLQEPQMSIQALKRFDMAVDLALCRTAEHVPRNPALHRVWQLLVFTPVYPWPLFLLLLFTPFYPTFRTAIIYIWRIATMIFSSGFHFLYQEDFLR